MCSWSPAEPTGSISAARRFRPGAMLLALVVSWCCGATLAAAQVPPVIDGKGQDLLDFGAAIDGNGCLVQIDDPNRTISTPRTDVGPCDSLINLGGGNFYFLNGMDLKKLALVYDRTHNDIYVLWRSYGIIGDINGNGDPDNGACTPPPGQHAPNIPDLPGIGSNEEYRLDFDFNCNNFRDPGEASIRVRDNTLSMFTGNEGVNETPIPIVSSQFAFRAVNGADGRDLEAVVHLGTGPGAFRLPVLFQVAGFSGSGRDFLGVDQTAFAPCGVANPDIHIDKTATPVQLCPGASPTVTLTAPNTANVPVTN